MIADAPQLPRNPFCAIKHCRNLIEFYPVVKVWSKDRSRTTSPLRMEIGVGFCRDHMNTLCLNDMNLEEVVTEQCKILKLVDPDFSSAKIEMKPISADGPNT